MKDQIVLPVNPITLNFHQDQRHIEKEHRSFYFKNNLSHFRLCHVFGIIFYSVFVFVDLQTSPESTSVFMIIRFAVVCPLFFVGIGLSYLPWYKLAYNYMIGFLVLLAAVGYITMGLFVSPSFHFIYFLGFLACLIFGYTFLRQPVWFATAIGWIAGTAYYLVQVKYGELDKALLNSYIAYLIGFEILLMTICYTAERSYRRNFYLFYLLSSERNKIKKINEELEDVVEMRNVELQQLEKALKKVKKLSGFLPICAGCKKIRDDKGYWNQIETYIRDHSEAEFSHGICPDCQKRLYPEFTIDKDDKT